MKGKEEDFCGSGVSCAGRTHLFLSDGACSIWSLLILILFCSASLPIPAVLLLCDYYLSL